MMTTTEKGMAKVVKAIAVAPVLFFETAAAVLLASERTSIVSTGDEHFRVDKCASNSKTTMVTTTKQPTATP